MSEICPVLVLLHFPFFKCFIFLIPIEDSGDGGDLGFERTSDWLLQDVGWLALL